MVEIETMVRKIGGSWYVQIPTNLVEYFKIREHSAKHADGLKDRAKIKDIDRQTLEVVFPLW